MIPEFCGVYWIISISSLIQIQSAAANRKSKPVFTGIDILYMPNSGTSSLFSMYKKSTQTCADFLLGVECIGFEPTTPALSRRCSKPAELTLLLLYNGFFRPIIETGCNIVKLSRSSLNFMARSHISKI